MFEIGANVANSKLVSTEFWLDNFLPYENRYVDFIQDQGVLGVFHNCGYAAGHLHAYHHLHHRMWGYMTPPPHGDTDLAEAVATLPQNLLLWGNIDQIDFLRQATPQEVEENVRQVIEIVKPRGNFILGSSDNLETGTPHENIRALVAAGRKYGAHS